MKRADTVAATNKGLEDGIMARYTEYIFGPRNSRSTVREGAIELAKPQGFAEHIQVLQIHA